MKFFIFLCKYLKLVYAIDKKLRVFQTKEV